jgi:phenylpyruvate tautomerase PptA (4-oxalocrotonate tautomerase family)
MPLVEIALAAGKPLAYRQSLGAAIHRALVETLAIPPDDHFQRISEHTDGNLIYDPGYMGITRSTDFVLIRITLGVGRTLAQKRALFQRISVLLAEKPGLRPQDIMIVLVETALENWSFGNGEGQYADRPPTWTPRE